MRMHTACWDGAACVVPCSGGRVLSAAPPFRERARGPHSPRLSSRAAALHARHAADTSGALMSVHEQGGTLLGERCAGAACDSLVSTRATATQALPRGSCRRPVRILGRYVPGRGASERARAAAVSPVGRDWGGRARMERMGRCFVGGCSCLYRRRQRRQPASYGA